MRSRLTLALLVAVSLLAPAGAAPAPGDPLQPLQWGLEQIHAPAAWEVTRGAGARLAVLGDGLDFGQEDLGARDSDGDFVSRVVNGITFVACGDAGCGDGRWEPSRNVQMSGVATHLAGVAVATTGNGHGIAGVAPEAQLLSVAMSGPWGINPADIARGIRWATDQGAGVIAFAFDQGAQPYTARGHSVDTFPAAPVDEAIAYAVAQGVVLVGEAHHAQLPYCADPAWHEDVLCVVGTTAGGQRSAGSNYPVKPGFLALAAPMGNGAQECGANVVGPVPPGLGRTDCGYPADRTFTERKTTSSAVGHVAGVAALLASLGCDREDSVALLTQTARNPQDGTRGTWSLSYGYGIVDAQAATDEALSACGD